MSSTKERAGRHAWAAEPCGAFPVTGGAANLQAGGGRGSAVRGIKLSARFPPPPPSCRAALTTAFSRQDGISDPGTWGPLTPPWVKGSSR